MAERRHLHVPLGEPERRRADQRRPRRRGLLHAGREMRGRSDRRVVEAQVAPDGADDDFAGVQADADLGDDALLLADAVAP